MKVAITGHTADIGLAIAQKFHARGDEVVGLSRTTGYELPGAFDRVVDAAEHCDIFVNNVHVYNDDTQLRLLYEMFRRWEGQYKRIITLGSRAGDYYITGNINEYATYKAALDVAHRQLFSRRDQRPMVHNIRPGYVDTGSVRGNFEPKMTTEQVADVVMYVIDSPVYIGEVTLCRQKVWAPPPK